MKPKSSTGYDNTSNKLIKSVKDVLIKPLTLLMNQITHTGDNDNDNDNRFIKHKCSNELL